MAELERKLIEEETALRVKQGIEKRVQEVMASDVVQQQLQQHLHTERQRLEKQVPCLVSGSPAFNSKAGACRTSKSLFKASLSRSPPQHAKMYAQVIQDKVWPALPGFFQYLQTGMWASRWILLAY